MGWLEKHDKRKLFHVTYCPNKATGSKNLIPEYTASCNKEDINAMTRQKSKTVISRLDVSIYGSKRI